MNMVQIEDNETKDAKPVSREKIQVTLVKGAVAVLGGFA